MTEDEANAKYMEVHNQCKQAREDLSDIEDEHQVCALSTTTNDSAFVSPTARGDSDSSSFEKTLLSRQRQTSVTCFLVVDITEN